MKLQFDPNQQFQLDAVSAITDLFEGQPTNSSDFSIINTGMSGTLFAGVEQNEKAIGNALTITNEKILENLRKIQLRNDIEFEESKPLESWEHFDIPANQKRVIPHFSVEMETGTGKTYVYLRTIFELSHRYGFQKFIIVVPSVAIREGVLKNIEITTEHFKALYNNKPFSHLVYDSKKLNSVRDFATRNFLQIQIINIDAFRKNFTGTEDEKKSNVIYRGSEKALGGDIPIELIQKTRPIVIIDEPQNMESDRSEEAIKALNPLMTLRYSATHKNPYNLAYRLDPVRAFELRLVKRIVVGDASGDTSANDPFIKVEKVEHTPSIRAKIRMFVKQADGPKEKLITVKKDDDLQHKSGDLEIYRGYQITGIDASPDNPHIKLSNGTVLRLGQEIGGIQDDIWKEQIKKTIEEHLKKELQVQSRGIKVLSLFFVDKVANYRDYDSAGRPVAGKFAQEFESAFRELIKDSRFKDISWVKEPIEALHNGYFAQDKKAISPFESIKSKTDKEAEESMFNLIMKDKEKLLSQETPLRFIFSHSALREGWDNPNVFQICTLNETKSAIKKRQEIGRGLRLPVNQNGERIFDESVNKLFVMANENYNSFARALQNEYEEDCGVTFGKVPITALAKLITIINGEEKHIGKDTAEKIKASLIEQSFLDVDGKIQPSFVPTAPDFKLTLPSGLEELTSSVIDLLSSRQIERFITRAKNQGDNNLKKQVTLSPEFQTLWEKIKPRTTYRVEFDTNELILKASKAISTMPTIKAPQINITVGQLNVTQAGVETQAISNSSAVPTRKSTSLPDILGYLQNETELTRLTLVKVLKESKRLDEVFVNPQKFLDQVASIIKYELHRLLIDGIKYEKLPIGGSESEWEMRLFKEKELIDYLNALSVKKSIYEYVVYDSEVEKEFAKKLDEREDIKLFVKLPAWFKVETPIGTYNPDWAIIKQDGKAFYLIRETKGTKDFLKLRTSEADKIRCGVQHFKELGVDFAVAVTANEI